MANDPCTHAEVCGLTIWRPGADKKPYCILHFPDLARKDGALFEKMLKAHLQANKSDLRYVVWPEQYETPSFSNKRFSSDVNLEGAILGRGILHFDGATCERDLIVKVRTLRAVHLSSATFEGNLVIEVDTGECGITLERVPVVRGSTRISTSLSHVRLGQSHFLGPVEIKCRNLSSLDLSNATFDNGLTLRGNLSTDRTLAIGSARGVFDWQECTFPGDLRLENLQLKDVKLDLSRCRVAGSLTVSGPWLPPEVRCNGMSVGGPSKFVAPLGAPRLRLVATDARPEFSEKVTFVRVDLSDCRLVGNVWDSMTFLDAEWHTLNGRSALFDETCFRSGERHLLRPLRESYQVLKERYRALGDHVRSGDFHYGEMEMKVQEAGRLRRWASPEFWYGLSSGYGTRWLRAGWCLLFLLLLFADVYMLTASEWFSHDYWKALRFSLSVATLQRPDIPPWFSQAGRWVMAAESILAPIQIALLVLALRMRVKR